MKLAIYSNMEGFPWGASEELWSQTALVMQQRGHSIAVNYQYWPTCPERLRSIQQLGGSIAWRRLGGRAKWRRSLSKRLPVLNAHERWLARVRPDLALISTCAHFGDVCIARACQRRGIPYGILVHGASDAQWIAESELDPFRKAFLGARMCFFVSDRGRQVMEANLAVDLPRARVVENPLAVRPPGPLAWPDDGPPWRLACVARLDFPTKGQDIILKVLSSRKWRRRPLSVSFWGDARQHKRQFVDLASRYGLDRCVKLCGFVRDVERIWSEHHALLLPSRQDAVPLVTAEAMFCGRVPIVTRCGRNDEFVDDGETGFLAAAATAELVDEALERAWSRRRQWREMGRLGAKRISQRYGRDPVERFRREIEQLAADGEALRMRGRTRNRTIHAGRRSSHRPSFIPPSILRAYQRNGAG